MKPNPDPRSPPSRSVVVTHRVHSLIGFRKSSSPQNCRLNISISNSGVSCLWAQRVGARNPTRYIPSPTPYTPGDARPVSATQGPSWGYFKNQFLTGLSSVGDCSPQNGSKTVPKSQNRPLGYPLEGPFVDPGVDRQRPINIQGEAITVNGKHPHEPINASTRKTHGLVAG